VAIFAVLVHHLFVSDRIGLFSSSWWTCCYRPFVFL